MKIPKTIAMNRWLILFKGDPVSEKKHLWNGRNPPEWPARWLATQKDWHGNLSLPSVIVIFDLIFFRSFAAAAASRRSAFVYLWLATPTDTLRPRPTLFKRAPNRPSGYWRLYTTRYPPLGTVASGHLFATDTTPTNPFMLPHSATDETESTGSHSQPPPRRTTHFQVPALSPDDEKKTTNPPRPFILENEINLRACRLTLSVRFQPLSLRNRAAADAYVSTNPLLTAWSPARTK